MNSSDTTATNSVTASPPFDDPKADLIIHSSDGIHFYVHRLLLSLLSTFFEGMFTIPNNGEEEFHDNRPCVSVSDDSHRLRCLLSWCDPRCMRSITSLDDVRNTLEMADKYGMDIVTKYVEKTVLSPGTRKLMESEPLALFAIAIRFRLDDLALQAAKQTLRVPFASRETCHDLKYISAFSLQHLSDYHNRCIKRAKKCTDQDDLQWARTRPGGSEFVFIDRLHRTEVNTNMNDFILKPKYRVTDSHDNDPKSPRARFFGTECVGWWDRYMDRVCVLLNETPYGLVVQTPSLLRDIRSTIASESCERCQKRGYEDLAEFSVLLSEKIDKALSQVPFHIEY